MYSENFTYKLAIADNNQSSDSLAIMLNNALNMFSHLLLPLIACNQIAFMASVHAYCSQRRL